MSSRTLCIVGLALMGLAVVSYFINADGLEEKITQRLEAERCKRIEMRCGEEEIPGPLCNFLLTMNACPPISEAQ